MLKILILICPMTIDNAACNIETAIDVVRTMPVSSPQQCGFMGQATLASTALVPDPSKQYVKIVCARISETTTVSASRRSPVLAETLPVANRAASHATP